MTLIFLAAVGLRLASSLSLYGRYHPDEPHHINIALNFGTGDLNPHVFKYPTFWMYFLFFIYGCTYLIWSGFGLLHSVADFACLFINNPLFFYYVARAVSILVGSLCVIVIYKAGKELSIERVGMWAALIVAVSPEIIIYGGTAKPDMLMLLFCSFGWFFGAKYFRGGKFRDGLATGLCLGFAASTQYTAGLLLSPLLFFTHFSRQQWKLNRSTIFAPALLVGYIGLGFAFIMGTPFALLEQATFVRDLKDLLEFGTGIMQENPQARGLKILLSMSGLVGPIPLGLGLILIGAIVTFKYDRRIFQFLVFPITLGGILWSRQTWPEIRYGASIFPGIALLSASGWCLLQDKFLRSKWFSGILLVVLIIPASFKFLFFINVWRSPDPNKLAKIWIETHIPVGSRLLVDQTHATPPLAMSQTQIQRLYEKTSKLGHPRANYFKTQLECGVNGKYEIFQIQRSYLNLLSMKRHVEWSQLGYEMVDARGGWNNLIDAGIDYVIESDFGYNSSTANPFFPFFKRLREEGRLLAAFESSYLDERPAIRIYKISHS